MGKKRQMKAKAVALAGTALSLLVAVGLGMVNRAIPDANQLKRIADVGPAPALAAVSTDQQLMPHGTSLEPNRRRKPETHERVITLGEGDTLIKVLLQANISQLEARAVSEALRKVFDPRDLKTGQTLWLFIGEHDNNADVPSLRRLELVPETDRLISVEHLSDEAFETRTSAISHKRQLRSKRGTIRSSLYETARVAKVPAEILKQARQILSYRLDLQRDLRDGDTFQIVFEVLEDGLGRGRHPGELIFAAIGSGQRSLRIFRHTTADGYTGFFDDKGNSIETSLMKTPVDGGRLSSLFGKRDHPVLGYTRMHRGVDFTARRGTPVRAAGDGTIVRRRRKGSFGKYVEIRHNATYATAYAHLSRYVEGAEPGARIQKGDVIGYVGATGLATGPNVHYEVLRNGEQVDPMRLELPPRRILEGDDLTRFEQEKAMVEAL